MGYERAKAVSMRGPRWSESRPAETARTALTGSNILALPEGDERPSVVVHLEKYYDSRSAMEAVIAKMVRLRRGIASS